jgi:hypothetical protein
LNRKWDEYKTNCDQWKQDVDSFSSIHAALVGAAAGNKEDEEILEKLFKSRDNKKLAMKRLIMDLLDLAKKY